MTMLTAPVMPPASIRLVVDASVWWISHKDLSLQITVLLRLMARSHSFPDSFSQFLPPPPAGGQTSMKAKLHVAKHILRFFFVIKIEAQEINESRYGSLLHGFYETPPLDVEITWSETHNAFIQSNYHKVLARRQIDILIARAWLSESKQLEAKVSNLSMQTGVPSVYTNMVLVQTDKRK